MFYFIDLNFTINEIWTNLKRFFFFNFDRLKKYKKNN